MGSAKDRDHRWAIAPPPSPESATISEEFRLEPPPRRGRRQERRPAQSDRLPLPTGRDTIEPVASSEVRALSEPQVEDQLLPESQRVTEVPATLPELFSSEREADTIPVPADLCLDLDDELLAPGDDETSTRGDAHQKLDDER